MYMVGGPEVLRRMAGPEYMCRTSMGRYLGREKGILNDFLHSMQYGIVMPNDNQYNTAAFVHGRGNPFWNLNEGNILKNVSIK